MPNGIGFDVTCATRFALPAILARSIVPVRPYSRLMPYTMMPVERPPKMTYFIDASADFRLPLWKPESEYDDSESSSKPSTMSSRLLVLTMKKMPISAPSNRK
jgi:hypothetical protein